MKTTIQITPETKDMISSFGMKGETYEVIIKRMYDLAVKEHLRQFLMPSDRFIPIDDVIKEAEKKWPKSK